MSKKVRTLFLYPELGETRSMSSAKPREVPIQTANKLDPDNALEIRSEGKLLFLAVKLSRNYNKMPSSFFVTKKTKQKSLSL